MDVGQENKRLVGIAFGCKWRLVRIAIKLAPCQFFLMWVENSGFRFASVFIQNIYHEYMPLPVVFNRYSSRTVVRRNDVCRAIGWRL